MTLDQYLSSESISDADFGASCKPPISGPSIWRIRHGKQNTSADIMNRIIAASGYKVSASGLLAARHQSEAA